MTSYRRAPQLDGLRDTLSVAERIVVLVESDVDAPIAHGFVARHAAVIESLRRHGAVEVVGITSVTADRDRDASGLIVVPEARAHPTDARRLFSAAATELGRFGIGRDLKQLRAAVAALRPTMIVCLTWQRREVVRAVGAIAPTALFAEERLSVMAGQPLRWTFPPPVVSAVEMRAQRRAVALARVIAVIGPAEVAWATTTFHRPVVVVPQSSAPVHVVEEQRRGAGFDVAVVGNFDERRNADGLVDIIDEAARRGWPDQVRFRVVSAAGYDQRITERAGPHVVLEGGVDDIGPLLATSRCRLVPAFSALGIKGQILQGWAARLPVVTTERSARTVGGRDGVDVLVGATPGEIVDILSGIGARDDLDEIVDAGFARLQADFSPAKVDEAVDEVVRLVTSRK